MKLATDKIIHFSSTASLHWYQAPEPHHTHMLCHDAIWCAVKSLILIGKDSSYGSVHSLRKYVDLFEILRQLLVEKMYDSGALTQRAVHNTCF